MSAAQELGPGDALAPPESEKRTQESDVPAEIGEVIGGRYRIDRVLAEGGMGVVCLGQHVELEQPIAIKFLRPELCKNPSIVERFLNEARAAAALQSPHVVRVMDVGQLPSGRPYLVMERLQGVDLDALVEKRGALPIDQALDYVLQALEALAEAHGAGIVHRDIKPENLFLCDAASGGVGKVVKIVDFGLAKRLDNARSKVLTGPQDAMGSPCYMSPEQVTSPASVDARTDIWSMGVVLYRLVTGILPFDGDTLAEVCARVLHATPAPISGLRRGVDVELDAIVRRCLEKRAALRYQSVEELRDALSSYRGVRFSDTVPNLGTLLGAGRLRRSRSWPWAVALLLSLTAAGLYEANAKGRVDLEGVVLMARRHVRPVLLPDPSGVPSVGSHAGPTASFLLSDASGASGEGLDRAGVGTSGAVLGEEGATAASLSVATRNGHQDGRGEGPLPGPEPVFDAPARTSVTEGAVDGIMGTSSVGPGEGVPSSPGLAGAGALAGEFGEGSEGASSSAPSGSAKGESPLTPEEISRRKRAYKAYLERRGLTPLRDVLGRMNERGIEGAPVAPPPR